MKVLHVVETIQKSGAGKAAFRLHSGLLSKGVDSRILVRGINNRADVIGASSKFTDLVNKAKGKFDLIPLQLYKNRAKVPYSVQLWGGDALDRINDFGPDVLNFHNWNLGGFLSIRDLSKISVPIVWTLHDMWPFTGGCHYSDSCNRYEAECGKCPILRSTRKFDLSHWTWKRKKRTWSGMNITMVGLSRWLHDCAKKSSLLKGIPAELIPNGIDLTEYKLIEKETARKILNLPQSKFFVLFLSQNPQKNSRKGFDLLQRSIDHLSNSGYRDQIELLVVGSDSTSGKLSLKLPFHNLGYFQDDISLNLIYAAADVFVAPSRQDNLPNTVLESMASGTPCVAFDIGGMPDMINDRENGYLADPYDVADLTRGIIWVFNENTKMLSVNARNNIRKNFTIEMCSRRYFNLYQELI